MINLTFIGIILIALSVGIVGGLMSAVGTLSKGEYGDIGTGRAIIGALGIALVVTSSIAIIAGMFLGGLEFLGYTYGG